MVSLVSVVIMASGDSPVRCVTYLCGSIFSILNNDLGFSQVVKDLVISELISHTAI